MIILITIIFGLQSVISNNSTFGQSIYHIEDVPGSSGNSTTPPNSSSGGINVTFIYVAGGLVVAGLLVYKLFIEKNENNKEKKSDSSSSMLKIPDGFLAGQQSFVDKKKLNIDLPVNFYMGIKDNFADLRKKSFILGVSIKL